MIYSCCSPPLLPRFAVDLSRSSAMKQYSLTASPLLLQVEREVAIHSKASHPHIVDCYVVFEDAAAIYLALEYAPGGDLMKVGSPLATAQQLASHSCM